MTALGQSALGLGIVREAKSAATHNSTHRGSKGEKGAKSFDDLMLEAEGKPGRTVDIEDDAAKLGDATATDSKIAGKSGHIQISAGLQQVLKVANHADNAAQIGQSAASKAEDNRKAEKSSNAHMVASAETSDDTAQTPAEQLSGLLGLAPDRDRDEVQAHSGNQDSKPARTAETTVETKENAAVDKGAASATIDMLKDAAAHIQGATDHGHRAERNASAAGGDDDGSAAVVRLISKDGKGAPLAVPLADAADATETEKPSQAGGKTDFVTVLESRRYLGFSTDSNVTALANAIRAEPTWSQALQAVTSAQNAIDGNTTTAVNTLKLQMNPESLGSMTASLRLKGEDLTVEVRVETVDAYRQLSGDHDTIVKALKDQGFNIDQVTILLNAPEKSTELGQDWGNQSSNGQDAPDSLGQNAKQREENERRTGNRNLWRNNEQTSSQVDRGNGTDGGGSGGIYL